MGKSTDSASDTLVVNLALFLGGLVVKNQFEATKGQGLNHIREVVVKELLEDHNVMKNGIIDGAINLANNLC